MADEFKLNKRNTQTRLRIFKQPVPSNIPWRDIERLFVALDGVIEEGSGSRVAVTLSGQVAVFHRPHPGPDTDKGAVAAVRAFLEQTGHSP